MREETRSGGLSPTDLAQFLNEHFLNSLCVKVRPAHGSALLLGFGPTAIRPPDPVTDAKSRTRHVYRERPPYELQVDFCRWTCRGPAGVSLPDYEIDADQILGKRLLEWEFTVPWPDLRLRFETQWEILITPHGTTENEVAWMLWDSHNVYLAAREDGSVYRGHGSDPA